MKNLKYIFESDIESVSKECGLSRQNVRKLDEKLILKGTVFNDYRGKASKLAQTHINFIEKCLNIPDHRYGNTMFDLHEKFIAKFNFDKSYISVRFLLIYEENEFYTQKNNL